MQILIKDRKVELKFNFRAEMLYEEVNGKSFSGHSNSAWLMYMYCTLISNTEDGFIGFKEFIEWLSDNPTTFYDFIKYYTDFQANILEMTSQKKKKKVKSKEEKQ